MAKLLKFLSESLRSVSVEVRFPPVEQVRNFRYTLNNPGLVVDVHHGDEQRIRTQRSRDRRRLHAAAAVRRHERHLKAALPKRRQRLEHSLMLDLRTDDMVMRRPLPVFSQPRQSNVIAFGCTTREDNIRWLGPCEGGYLLTRGDDHPLCLRAIPVRATSGVSIPFAETAADRRDDALVGGRRGIAIEVDRFCLHLRPIHGLLFASSLTNVRFVVNPTAMVTTRARSAASRDTSFGYVFPVVRGTQAGREYYTSMCPLRLIPKIFLFDEEEMPPELRAQRILNKARVPEMARYVIDNVDDYVFSAITASIDAVVQFEALGPAGEASRVGLLRVPMDAKFIINDGQHRRAAIETALRENPDLGDESIAVVFFLDLGLQRCQQMFADLNRYAIRPNKSIGVLYDHRDDKAKLARLIVLKSDFFRDIVELERSTLSPRSRKLFTLSAIYTATRELLDKIELENRERAAAVATEFWSEVAKCFPEWNLVRERKMSAGEVREDFIHSHGVVLQAIGRVGNALLRDTKDWRKRLASLSKVNWSRTNSALWEGRAMVGGHVQKGSQNIVLTVNVIKDALGLPLGPEEQRTEEAFSRKGNGKRR